MKDCFVSYKRDDEARVRPIVEGLRKAGLQVWWDRDIGVGDRWRETIEMQLDDARCVVVCWTKASVGGDGGFVREEAERAKARQVLLPVLLDTVVQPFGFGEVQALDLRDWTGRVSDPVWLHFVAAARAIAAGEPPPKPPLRRMRGWRFMSVVTGFAAIAILVANLPALQSVLCRIDGLHSVCREFGFHGVASLAEEKAWNAASGQPDGAGYRSYLRNYPDGVFTGAAQARLAACHFLKEDQVSDARDVLPMFVSAGPVAKTEAGALGAALPGAIAQAQEVVCAAYEKTGHHRLKGIKLDDDGWRCQQSAAGWRCSYDGKASCEIEIHSTTTQEVC